jgi:ATP-dependent protease Clp ATPase subunit
VLIKGHKWATIIANTIYFGVYTAVLKQLTTIDNLWVLVIVTMVANFIGTWIGIEVTEKLRKADLWTINTVVKAEYLKDYKKALNEANIKYISYQTTWDECSAVDIFSETRAESKTIKKILEQFNVKYSIHTSHKKL